ncbi:MAG TPA: biotin transporter BioY [bacterium]|nr:biotin transporter BioY [bacterium]HNS48713.1 biotin transporter BioY [bacterium]
MKRFDSAGILAFGREETLTVRLLLSLTLAGVTGLLAGIRVPLPFTPIPLTGQVLGVYLAGLLLDAPFAGLSLLFYLVLGLAGLPWFAGWQGLNYAGFLAYPSAGYLLGFIPAAFLIGRLLEDPARRSLARQVLAYSAGTAVFYFCGAAWLAALTGAGFIRTLAMSVYPFVIFDLLKALMVASFASALIGLRR